MKRGKYITALILFAAATVLLALFNLDGFPQALPNTYKLVISNPAKVRSWIRSPGGMICCFAVSQTGIQDCKKVRLPSIPMQTGRTHGRRILG